MNTLFNMHWYKQHIQGKHEVMIGYSGLGQRCRLYVCQLGTVPCAEELTAIAKNTAVQLTLFHGRGGSISRGGAPTQQALFSQPPGSISGAIRVTEQGEMIRFKFGLEGIALQNLRNLYRSDLRSDFTSTTRTQTRMARTDAQHDRFLGYRCIVKPCVKTRTL